MKKDWTIIEAIATIRNRWIEVIGESVLDSDDRELMYWRVKRADSVLVIPVQDEQLILLNPSYRHGIQEVTYDFPGGRHEGGLSYQDYEESAFAVLERELRLQRSSVRRLVCLNGCGWAVDSSFSSQHVHVFEALIHNTYSISKNMGMKISADPVGVSRALSLLCCLQCRCALLDWAWQKGFYGQIKAEDWKKCRKE